MENDGEKKRSKHVQDNIVPLQQTLQNQLEKFLYTRKDLWGSTVCFAQIKFC